MAVTISRKTYHRSLALLVFVAINLLVVFFLPVIRMRYAFTSASYSDTWQTFTLAGGQTLYGHIKGVNSTTIEIADVYYLSIVEVAGQKNTVLTRHGDVDTIPYNSTFINRSSLLYWGPVDPKAKVLDLIRQKERGV